jgi:hypothetical protein
MGIYLLHRPIPGIATPTFRLTQQTSITIPGRTRFLLCCITTLTLFLTGCVTADAVSKFCASAATTLASAKPVFNDMKSSCLRSLDAREPIGSYKTAATDQKLATSVAACNAIGTQADGTTAAATILSNYFTAINALASFGTAKAGTDAQALATKTEAALGASPAAQTATGSIVGDLTSVFASGYQLKKLESDLTRVSKNITAVSDGLITIVQQNYIDQLLADEESKTAARYKEFYQPTFTPEAKVMLEDRWSADQAAIRAKRASALSLIAALQALSKGFADLATNAHTLKAKELPSLLAPYVTQLQTLIPQIQKAF